MTPLDLLHLPWTIVRSEYDDDGPYVALHVAELPGFVAAAPTDDELEALFWPAFLAFLESYTSQGILPPLPTSGGSASPQLELLASVESRRSFSMIYEAPETTSRTAGIGRAHRHVTAAST